MTDDSTQPGTWRPIAEAPKDTLILLYGVLDPHADDVHLYSNLEEPTRCVGFWDALEQAWSIVGSIWTGPWFKPTHFMPLPSPPTESSENG